MNSVAAILNSLVLYRYSLILGLSGAAGLCFFMACCSHAQIPVFRSSVAAFLAVVLSLPLARLFYWYGRPDRFPSLFQAITSPDTEAFALSGAMAGCILAVFLSGRQVGWKKLLDCMCVAGCGAIALGRLGCFFTETDRGQIMTRLTSFPWAYPVTNASGQLEYRFATFAFQAAAAAALGIFLAMFFFRKKPRSGDTTILFLLFYSASQVILDSTRYDSLYLRSNGFVSMVQVFSAASLVSVLVFLCIRTAKRLGWRFWMVFLWISLVALFALTGYMEYYVQRHGREAAFAYSIMGSCLTSLVGLGLLLWHLSRKSEENTPS